MKDAYHQARMEKACGLKKARMLLRVSSDRQLEADGDLGVQRQLVKEYAAKQKEWILDEKEYFEGSNSGYRNSVAERCVLQDALQDAKRKEYDILVAYKDDRIGRRMWEIGAYVMALKEYGVDIYTVKDGCISPEADDIMGQMILALRYGNAQKSSSDTGMRVKDTAQKLVQQGKFMGGAAPYGYKLELSGEISRHGRALKHLVVMPERAEIVKYIYDLSLHKEYGSAKIAKTLNEHEIYKYLAPRDFWKSGTITSILTNPIYAGHTAYKRRERVNGKKRRLSSEEWVTSLEANENIRIIDDDTWNRTQKKRRQRGDKYIKSLENKDTGVIRRNDGMLSLIDVLYCGYCGRKMTNGSKYNYWTIKGSGEKRTSKTAIYKCQEAWQGVLHEKTRQVRADQIEPIIFGVIAQYIGKLQEEEDIVQQIREKQNREIKRKKEELRKEKEIYENIRNKVMIMEEHIPDAMAGDYPLSLQELVTMIHRQKEQAQVQRDLVCRKETELEEENVSVRDRKSIKGKLPTWQDVFLNADTAVRRVLIGKLVERIDVKKTEITIRLKVSLDDFFPQSRTSDGFGVQKPGISF